MPAYQSKSKDQILRHALKAMAEKTDITATGPGSIARGLMETITDEIGEFHSILDFNVSQSVLSTASGRSLDLMGQMYNVQRKQLSDLAATDAQTGSFYFYLDSPHSTDVIIPRGTRVSTPENEQLGTSFIYGTTETAIITKGRLRAYAGIKPLFEDSIFTAGAKTITEHDFTSGPVNVDIHCINPKAIAAQVGYERDDDYRVRMIKGVRTAAGGTEEALRFTALAVPGVRDVRIRTAPFGLGTFEVIVTAEDYTVINGLLGVVRGALERSRATGTRMWVNKPSLLYVDINAVITVKPEVDITNTGVTRRVENAILRYLNTLLVGDPLVYNQLVSYILEAAEFVSDVTVTSLTINSQEVLRRNYTPKDNEQLVPGSIEVSVA